MAGAGKAAVPMAAALVEHYGAPVAGAVVTVRGQGRAQVEPEGKAQAQAQPRIPVDGSAIPGIEILAAGHPVPDAASVAAGARMLAIAREAQAGDRLIMLLSGGASALMVQPAAGVTLEDKQDLSRRLLASGAGIDVINGIRPKLSAIKGGRLAAAAVARPEILVLAVSDVPGDGVGRIGSGPCSPDPVSLATARADLARFHIEPGPRVRACLADPAREPLPASHPAFARCRYQLITRSADGVAAAARVLAGEGFRPVVLPEATGPARDTAAAHAALAAVHQAAGERVALVSGGETTVALGTASGPGPAAGRGGRNTEYLLALALELAARGITGVHALAADTDGIDGTGPHAGAWLDPATLDRCRRAGADPAALLAGHASADAFAAAGGLLVTGTTGTNVNDLRIILTGA